ncbi:MAG: hypothetical protein AMXMBFR7_10980 [Planctomycetota bacterium]
MAARSGSTYPVFLKLAGVPVLVVGGGVVAARKVRGLASAGARITIVAPQGALVLAKRKSVILKRRRYRSSDLRGMRLVVAATDDRALNTRIATECRARSIWCNVAAPPEAGDVILPAVVRRGRLQIAMSTGGASAAASKALREELERHLDPAWGVFLALLEARRERIKRRVTDPARRRRLLQDLGAARWVRRIRERGREAVAAELDAQIDRVARADRLSMEKA